MILKKGKLKVHYFLDDDIAALKSEDIDNALEKALKPLGFKRYASGFTMENNVRDVAFERAGQ